MALELRPNGECCDRDLAPASTVARICSYECTFCAACMENVLLNVCPNCGGGFVAAHTPGDGMATRSFGCQAPAFGQAQILELQPRGHRRSQPADQGYSTGEAVSVRQGHLEPAITLLEQCLDLSRATDVPVLVVQMAMRLGCAYVLSGRVTEAI